MLRWPGLLLRPLALTFGQNRKNGLSSLSRKSAIFVISLEHCSDVGALMVLQIAQVQDGTVSSTPGEGSRSRSSQHQGTFSAREARLWNSIMSTTDVTQSDTYGNTIYKRGEKKKQTGREKEREGFLSASTIADEGSGSTGAQVSGMYRGMSCLDRGKPRGPAVVALRRRQCSSWSWAKGVWPRSALRRKGIIGWYC